MSHLRVKTITHKQAVCALYKKIVRNLESYYFYRDEARYQCVVMRHKFDLNKDIKDPRVAKTLLREAEEKLESVAHPSPICFPTSPGGAAYERWPHIPDWVMDYWHPNEKAQYPKYFATREKRKIEYMEYIENSRKRLAEMYREEDQATPQLK